jgi:hypothetical protein
VGKVLTENIPLIKARNEQVKVSSDPENGAHFHTKELAAWMYCMDLAGAGCLIKSGTTARLRGNTQNHIFLVQ